MNNHLAIDRKPGQSYNKDAMQCTIEVSWQIIVAMLIINWLDYNIQ